MVGNKRCIGETVQTLHFLVQIGLPLVLFFVILVIAFNIFLPSYLSPRWVIEAPLALLVMNTLFGIITFVVALIALRAYITDVSVNLLLFGCGTLSLSLTCFVAGWFGAQAQANVNLTIHNTGVLLASLFTLFSSIALISEESLWKRLEKEKRSGGILAYLGVMFLIAALSFAAVHGYTPPFDIPGYGPTLLREVVVMAATAFFGVSCLLIVIIDRYRRSFFLSCYALALGLITISLIVLITSQRANSALSWLGRFAQYTAGIYFLAAVVAAVRTAWANRWTVPDTVRDFLRPSEALYRDLVETATDAILLISTSGEILLWNTAAEQMFGYKRRETFKLAPADLIDPEDSKRLLQEIGAGVVSGKRLSIGKVWEVKARRKSGEQFPAELSFSSRRSGSGRVSTLVIRDITERRQIEQALRESEAKAKALIKYAPTGIYEIDYRGPSFVSINDAMCQILGYTREELFAMEPSGLLDDESRALFADRVRRQLAGEKTEESVEFRVRKKDGSLIDAILNVSLNVGGDPNRALVVAHDITERKRMEEDLRRSRDESEMRVQERTKELRKVNEALRAGNEECQKIESELRESEDRLRELSSALLTAQENERKVAAQEIHDSIGASLAATKFRMKDVITKVGENRPQTRTALETIVPMLQGAIEEARRIQMALRPSILDDLGILMTINWFCRQFESTYSHIRIGQGISIEESEVPDSLKIVIFRVLQEAMNNAAKHSKADRINILFRKMGGRIELRVEDYGQGFDLSEAYSRKGTSRGLGLDSMRERTELSGGSFSVESSKGAGTVIKATWPLSS